ncbi:hypothetical protein O181_100663 [Austropuccinia psidii MF-1]|uniref:Uncharacterized protein n=1 Tax=Austropuccinia psidii MF-1 TaxID=1389203 RepID=A0A9Q3JD39_9BASI|nr:hypothetical protein [Austropuccinia psidii MF-1]
MLRLQAENINKIDDGLSRWALDNTSDNQAYVPLEEEPYIPIEGIKIFNTGTKFFEEFRESYKKDKNFHIFKSFLDKYCKNTDLANSLDEIWKHSFNEGIYHLFDGIVYQKTANSHVITLCSTLLINTILHEFHDCIYYGHLSEDRKIGKVQNCAWQPSWR